MNKKEALKEINDTQDFYVEKLTNIILGADKRFDNLNEIDFTSPTGTGKTVMVAKLINSLPDHFFFITSLSKGQLRYQIETSIRKMCKGNNYVVFGLNDFTKNTILQKDGILKLLPDDKTVIWIRDEGHIATNRWQEILRSRSKCIVNFSATNKSNNGIQCNFSHTMMLRTVSQNAGTPEDALDQLLQIKKVHKNIIGYNPCALFRIIHDENLSRVISACEKRGLSYINITEEDYDMSDICKDENHYDVIINKFKITEGIDLKRCHIIYMDSKPTNEATVVQLIGRARRNALFWRNDVDILEKHNSNLLAETRKCFVYYNIPETEVAQNEFGELSFSLCDTVSVEALKPNIKIQVINGQLSNGLYVIELCGKSGTFLVSRDEKLGVNIVSNPDFYQELTSEYNPRVIDLSYEDYNLKKIYLKPNILDFFVKSVRRSHKNYDNRKYVFYFVKLYCLRNPGSIDLDVDYWEYYLEMDNKAKLVNDKKWGEFLYHSPKGYYPYRERVEKYFEGKLDSVDWQNARQYAAIDHTQEFTQKKEIFIRYCWDDAVSFTYDFQKYIEKVDYFSTSFAIDVAYALEKLHNVRQITSNKYIYSKHPFIKYLKEKDIKTLSQLAEMISSYKGKMLFGCNVPYWKAMLNSVNSFEEIDDYDTKLLTFEELNEVAKLGYSPSKVKQYSRGIYRVKSGTSLSPGYLMKLNHTTNVPEFVKSSPFSIYKRDFINRYEPYSKRYNDYEIAAIGPDLMRYYNHHYVEELPITSKIHKYCKFNRFISEKYSSIISEYGQKCFAIKNDLGFDKKCNSCLGFCVEYYAKIKLFGEEAFSSFIEMARIEAKTDETSDIVRVRASMLIYREAMKRCYGSSVAGIIPSISVENLIKANYSSFVDKVVELGNKAAQFILENVYGGVIDSNTRHYDPNLSVNHISALCDFISKDTILDLKCTSCITEKHIKQVLSYYYLSTKRSDLRINRLIVYDAITGRFVEIHISGKQ